MSAEWKPGDVGLIPFSGGEGVVGIFTHGGWVTRLNGNPLDYSDVRRLVVIDPEDREQIGRLVDLWGANEHLDCGSGSCAVDTLQTALREYANPKPPKPEMPKGIGAVAEDENGGLWVQTLREGSHGAWCKSGAGDTFRAWSEIPVVRVLSEGVQP